MYNRQQQQPNGLPVAPELQEQINLPITQLIIELRQGKTQKVAMKTDDGFFLSSINGGGGFVVANAKEIGPNETFLLVPQGFDRTKVAIRTINGNYISAVDGGGGRVDASSTIVGPNEQFMMVPVNPDKSNFITARGFLLLVLTTEPRFLTAYGIATGTRTRLTIIPQAL